MARRNRFTGLCLGALCALGGTGCDRLIGANFDVHLADAGDGSAPCSAAGCVETLAAHIAFPWDIVVSGGYVYWTVAGEANGTGSVMRMKAAGGPVEELVKGLTLPNRIQVVSDQVYWTSDAMGGGVLRMPVSGGAPEVFAGEPGGALGLAVNATNVYWTAAGMVKARALAAGPGSGSAISGTHPGLGLLASDGTYVYFGEFVTSGSVFRLNPATSQETPLAMGQSQPNGLTTTGGFLLFATSVSDGAVMRVATAGGGLAPVKDHQDTPTTVAVSGDFVYWPDFGAGTVNKILWGTSGSVRVLASQQASPSGIAVDESHVYWTNFDPDGSVMRAPK